METSSNIHNVSQSSDSHRLAVYKNHALWMLILHDRDVNHNNGQIHLGKIRSEWRDAAHNVKSARKSGQRGPREDVIEYNLFTLPIDTAS